MRGNEENVIKKQLCHDKSVFVLLMGLKTGEIVCMCVCLVDNFPLRLCLYFILHVYQRAPCDLLGLCVELYG